MNNPDKSYGQLKREQQERESDFLSELLGASVGEIRKLTTFEGDLSTRRNEILFKVTVEVEDTKSALGQAEQLVARLKKHLSQLEDLHRILSKTK